MTISNTQFDTQTDRLLTLTPPQPRSLAYQAVIRQQIAENKASLIEGVGAAVRLEWLGSSFARYLNRSAFAYDPNYDPTEDDKEALFDGLPDDYLGEFAQARSAEHADAIRGQLLSLVKARADLASLGFTGMGLQIGAAILDPPAIAISVATGGLGGALAFGTKATRLTRLARAGFLAGGTEAGIEAVLAQTDPGRGINDIIFAGLFGAAIGGAADVLFNRAVQRAAKDIQLGEVQAAMDASAAGEFKPRNFPDRVRDLLSDKGQEHFDDVLNPGRQNEVQNRIIDMLGLDEADKAELRTWSFEDFKEYVDNESFGEIPVARDVFTVEGINDSPSARTILPRRSFASMLTDSESEHVRWTMRAYADNALKNADGRPSSIPASIWKRLTLDRQFTRTRRTMISARRSL